MVYFKDTRKQVWATIIVGGLSGAINLFSQTLTPIVSGQVPLLSNFYPVTWQQTIGLLTLIYGIGLWNKQLKGR